MDITGQSIRTEPVDMGFSINSYYPTSLQRYMTAKSSGSRSSKSTYDREVEDAREQPALSALETVQRTVAQNPRQTIVSNGIMTAPLISGLASDPIGSGVRQNDVRLNEGIMRMNTSIVEMDTPKILYG